MTREWFDRQMTRMADLKSPPANVEGHFDALRDLPPDVLERAVGHALRTRAWFPTPAELRMDADAMAQPLPPDTRVRETPLPEPVSFTLPTGTTVRADREWTYDCAVCGDDGWQPYWCGDLTPECKPWQERRRCDRYHAHGSHEWVGRCACIETNPTIQRKRAAQTKYAQQPGKVA